MDSGAELTLQILRYVQQHPHGLAQRFPDSWVIWPRGQRASWSEARDLLTAVPKPVLVAPLLEPGTFALWTERDLDQTHRQALAPEFANQIQYYSAKLAALRIPPHGTVAFLPATPACAMNVDAFLRWAAEYGLGLGISLAASPDPHVAAITLRPPGGGGPPLGL